MPRISLRILLIIALMLCLSFAFAAAETTTETLDGITYTVKDGELIQVSGTSADGTVSVPQSIGGQALTSLGWQCFEDTSFTSIVLPEGVISLGHGAFREYESLRSISLPSTLTSVSSECFLGCSALEGITFPPGVTVLEAFALGQCTSLRTVTFLAPATDLSDFFIFQGNEALTAIYGDISAIGDYSFIVTNNLTTISLADSMTELPSVLSSMNDLIITVGQNSPLLKQLLESGTPCRIRETSEVFNVLNSSATTVAQKVKDVVAAVIHPGMSDYQKALALHNWLVRNACYDYTYSNYHADGVLLKGTGVCQSYTEAYALLLDAVGIPNCKEYGSDHVWNMIQLDGEWYHVDVTWDDPSSPGTSSWDFFCITNYGLEGISNHECFNKPHISTDYTYYYPYYSGQLDEWIDCCTFYTRLFLTEGKWTASFDPEATTGTGFGTGERTALLAMRDTPLLVNGKEANVEYHYDAKTWMFTYTVTSMSSPDLTLPEDLTAIEAEAFAGTPFRVIKLPDGLVSIGARAFADCLSLWQIEIPASVTSIDADAFAGVKGLCIFGQPGSTAEEFAAANGFGFFPLD